MGVKVVDPRENTVGRASVIRALRSSTRKAEGSRPIVAQDAARRNSNFSHGFRQPSTTDPRSARYIEHVEEELVSTTAKGGCA